MIDRNKSWREMCLLSERILRANSATEELQWWCNERSIGDGAIFAHSAQHAIPEALDYDSVEAMYPRQAGGRARFRRVRLTSSAIVIMDAINWYFSDHLNPEICERLETTNVSLEEAIAPLRPRRNTFLVRRCHPGQLAGDADAVDPTAIAFEHRAVMSGRNGDALAVVHERFRLVLVCRQPEQVPCPPHMFSLRNTLVPHPYRPSIVQAEPEDWPIFHVPPADYFGAKPKVRSNRLA
jgi:hypothetical protein